MTEEKNGVSHGPASDEMAPQEDGTKLPLADPEAGGNVKFSNNPPNGDAKVDMQPEPAFSGLTKEELMKYSDDPFWVRLRWFLFILFWLAWLAMLVMSIVIIVQAPRCEPKKTLQWVQESGMVQYDLNNPIDVDGNGAESPADMVQLLKDVGMTTVYLEDLINPSNYSQLEPLEEQLVKEYLKAASDAGLKVVTDFVPTGPVDPNNVWLSDPDKAEFFTGDPKRLDFSNEALLQTLTDVLGGPWHDMGVQGFLVGGPVDEEVKNATVTINAGLKDVDGVVVYGEVDTSSTLVSGFDAQRYQEFLENHLEDWAYYKYNPKHAASPSGINDPDEVSLVSLSLFLYPGTPIVDGLNDLDYLKAHSGYIKSLSELREKESIQVGDTIFANGTTVDEVSFVRMMKGVPGYTVSINLSKFNATMVDFTTIKGIKEDEKGEITLKAAANNTYMSEDLGRAEMKAVEVGASEGVVIQFVPSYS